jgi:antitoxin (DNA-binding transcriptional repressor) of toxin-antitoxin stability system
MTVRPETPILCFVTVELSEAQRDLARLVELASQGEDVLILVEGVVKARLTRVLPEESSPEVTSDVDSR